MIRLAGVLLLASSAYGAEFHVATDGNDANPGTKAEPFRTIQRAADLARPGDIVTVHEGVYRERVNPPRGGESEAKRIVYRAAPGERVEIRGSEVIRGWVRERGDVWKVTLSNAFFGGFNPYADVIHGDWFDPQGREHHTGAVYLDGDWLTEAASLDEVMMPGGTKPAWLTAASRQTLLNVAWLRPGGAGKGERTPAAGFTAQRGIQTAPCTEGGECIGWIEEGDWARYEGIELGQRTEAMELRVASATSGGLIEIRLGTPEGELLGMVDVPTTGDWQRWISVVAPMKPLGGKRDLCLTFRARGTEEERLAARRLNRQLWFARVDAAHTTIWAQFEGVDPNQRLVEINVRQSVFYPDQPGRDYIT
ncbi:MAG TPA: carbohydrate-binding protein, partial [Armatimonadota bacterium]|nr:carbohydrate-binding protein [Armatimonadota bacterium]